MDDFLRATAVGNGGYVLRSQLLDAGESDSTIRSALAENVLVRLRRGAFAFRDTYDALDPAGRHRVLAYSVADKLGPDVALSHVSACADHGLAQFDVDLTQVHVTRLDGGAGRVEAGIVHHVGHVLRAEHLVESNGRLVVRPARAVWEASTITSQRGALVVMDSSLHHGVVTREELEDAAGRMARWAGARRAGISLRFADGDAETPGESLGRFLCFEQGLPRPTLQHLVHDDGGMVVARTDYAWLQYAHVGEFDGSIKYLRRVLNGESVGEVLVREKRREDLVRRQLLGMSRMIWAEVLPRQARATGLMLRRDLEQSRSLYLHNRTVIGL